MIMNCVIITNDIAFSLLVVVNFQLFLMYMFTKSSVLGVCYCLCCQQI